MVDTQPEEIERLASSIEANTARVAEYLRSQHLPFPSFDADAPNNSLVPEGLREIEDARHQIIAATLKLHNLMLGPRELLQRFTHDELLSMQVIVRLNIATSFPIQKETSLASISSACGLDEPILRRILRHAMTRHIFKEARKGYVVHMAASRLLAEDSQLRDWVGASTDELWQAASQTVNALVKFPGSQEPNQTGFAIANNTEKFIHKVFSQHPQGAKRFGSTMGAFIAGTGYDLKHLLNNYPWASVGEGTIVDIGGSQGFVSVEIASSFPKIHCIVQDLPQVVEDGESKLAPELSDRVSFMAHDFNEQPVKNADVYLFRWIFRNWSDKYCVQMLRNLIPALKSGAGVVINDNCLPEPSVLSLWQEERLRSMDLTLLEIQNSCERDLEDWAALFEKADKRHTFRGGQQPEGSQPLDYGGPLGLVAAQPLIKG